MNDEGIPKANVLDIVINTGSEVEIGHILRMNKREASVMGMYNYTIYISILSYVFVDRVHVS